MKKHAVSLCLVLGCALLVSSGCAKNEMVKKDEPVIPAANAAFKPPVKSESAKEQITKAEAVKGQAVKKDMEKGNELQPIPNAAELTAALEKIYFDFDSANLSKEARATLAKNAELLKHEKTLKVQIEGNCDERGSGEYNLALGEKRAKAAEKYLVTMGVAAGRISTISYGKEKPADTGHDEAAWAKNRRDEFVLNQNK